MEEMVPSRFFTCCGCRDAGHGLSADGWMDGWMDRSTWPCTQDSFLPWASTHQSSINHLGQVVAVVVVAPHLVLVPVIVVCGRARVSRSSRPQHPHPHIPALANPLAVVAAALTGCRAPRAAAAPAAPVRPAARPPPGGRSALPAACPTPAWFRVQNQAPRLTCLCSVSDAMCVKFRGGPSTGSAGSQVSLWTLWGSIEWAAVIDFPIP